ncbi:unnamed protein product [Rhodiola kirilowii]
MSTYSLVFSPPQSPRSLVRLPSLSHICYATFNSDVMNWRWVEKWQDFWISFLIGVSPILPKMRNQDADLLARKATPERWSWVSNDGYRSTA